MRLLRPYALVAAAGTLCAAVALEACDEGGRGVVTEISSAALVGAWEKVTSTQCATIYPGDVIFKPGSLYEAPDGPEVGAFWHSGEYHVEAPATLVIQTANDAMVRYVIESFDDARMELRDGEGCTFAYVRAS